MPTIYEKPEPQMFTYLRSGHLTTSSSSAPLPLCRLGQGLNLHQSDHLHMTGGILVGTLVDTPLLAAKGAKFPG